MAIDGFLRLGLPSLKVLLRVPSQEHHLLGQALGFI